MWFAFPMHGFYFNSGFAVLIASVSYIDIRKNGINLGH